MTGIFLSYRRDDAAGWAGRLVVDLRRRFRDEHVFHDIAAIGAGEDFAQAIQRALGSCAVALVMIGPNWLSARDRRGELRLAQIDDPVRVEIRIALSRPDLLVVPVLVGGAAMPTRDELPSDIGALVFRNAAELSDARWDFDVEQLVRQLTRIQGLVPRQQRFRTMSLVLGAVALATMGLVWYTFRPGTDELPRPTATETSSKLAEHEQPLPTPPLQPPTAIAAPEAQAEPARPATGAKLAASPKPTKVALDGTWEADRPGGGRLVYEFETRRGEVFGSMTVQAGWGTANYGLLDGKMEGDRLKFCIQISDSVRKGEGWEYISFRECLDGIISGNEIHFISTGPIGHPTMSPQTEKLTARRKSK